MRAANPEMRKRQDNKRMKGIIWVREFLTGSHFLVEYSLHTRFGFFGMSSFMNSRTQIIPFILLLSCLFLISGFAALIYQIVWQRALFTAFGVNIESITTVVAVFMFGLGVGALVGGKLSQRWPNRLPQLFLLCELAIGAFGLVSLPLIK